MQHTELREEAAWMSDDSERVTDDRILNAIRERLARMEILKVDAVTITVADGEVTLDGTLQDYWRKLLADDVVRAIPGVRAVRNRLKIVPKHLQREIVPGMRVVNDLHEELGSVVEGYGDSFVMDCNAGPRVYVPFEAIQGVSDAFVVVDRMICPPSQVRGTPR
jgi:hypothetical protein